MIIVIDFLKEKLEKFFGVVLFIFKWEKPS